MQQSFIKFALEKNVLQFGDFTTKAGRKSPYFFNLASFDDGDSLKKLGEFYAEKIIEEKIEFDKWKNNRIVIEKDTSKIISPLLLR